MKLLTAVFLAAVAFVGAFEEETLLEGSKVYDVYPISKDHVQFVNGLDNKIPSLDIWQRAHVSGRHARILVPQQLQAEFVNILHREHIPYIITIGDVKSVIEQEKLVNEQARIKARSENDGRISFTAYHRHAEINEYLDGLAAKYPNVVTVESLGKSGKGLDMKVIRISTTGGADKSKPVIISDAGIHAREWIAPALSLYVITKLVEDVTESDVVDKIDWIIVPLLNPDGYEYSHTNTRLWRKTRSTESSTLCPGIDGNRNFDFKWMESGASSLTCAENYAGPRAFSEPETGYLRDLLEEYKGRSKLYLAMHSHGSYFLYPFGYDGSPTPDDAELHSLGLKVAAAIDGAALPGSQKYLVGNSGAALNYLAAGASDDYAYAVGEIKLAYTLELPSGGLFGFDLPPARIDQVVKESWQGILVLARYLIDEATKEGMSKVYNVFPISKSQVKTVNDLENRLPGLDTWQLAHTSGREARILVPRALQTTFESILNTADIRHEISIEDVKKVLEEEIRVNENARMRNLQDGRISFTAYQRHAEINSYLDDLAIKYQNLVTVDTLGQSSEGRDIKVIRISTTRGADKSKPVIISDAGIHAREWIAPAQALYVINKLVEDVTESDVVENVDWIIIPLLNPDGYEFSHTTTRLWRKTRTTEYSTICPGVDGNRNFDFQWMVSGSSSIYCLLNFAGLKPFSEPETRYLRDLMELYEGRQRLYLAMHSHGSYFLYPFGYNGLPTPDDAELHSLGLKVASAIDEASLPGSQKYLVGNSGAALNYLASGASDDYAYGASGIKLAYTLELPSGGSAGFDMPPEDIEQVVKETWPGILVLARYVIEKAGRKVTQP